MSVLRGKKILLGVSGGIAAYKTTFLVRLLIKEQAQVKVILTPAALDFVTPLTMATLSKNAVYSEFTTNDNTGVWNNHVDLGLWADFMIIAPATANTLAKMANGNCDNLLMAAYLSAKCPVFFAPAMDLDMYKHATTKESIARLERCGNKLIPAESGELASGLSGEGRMAEPENIISFLKEDLQRDLPLLNKKVMITAGPTYEAIDPVRFIGNHASGKMGFALAEKAAALGASVTLVSGPTHLNIKQENIKIFKVQSASDMYEVCNQNFNNQDIVIAAAAVADYKPAAVFDQKLKKNEDTFDLKLIKTIDVLASLGKKKQHQFLVGFALETQNEVENAKQKLIKKNLDLIVLNSLNDEGAGFGGSQNKVTLIDKNQALHLFDLKPKEEVAADILNLIIKKLHE